MKNKRSLSMAGRVLYLLPFVLMMAVLLSVTAPAQESNEGGQAPEKISFVKIIMKDGTEVFGNMLGYSKGYIILEVDHGELEIPVNLVKEIEYEPKEDDRNIKRWKPISYQYKEGRGVVDDPKTFGGRIKIVKGMGFMYRFVPFDNPDKCSYAISNLVYYCSKLKMQKQVITKLSQENKKLKEFNPNTSMLRLKLYFAMYLLYKSLGDEDSEQSAKNIEKAMMSLINGPRQQSLKNDFSEVLKQTKQKLTDAKLEMK